MIAPVTFNPSLRKKLESSLAQLNTEHVELLVSLQSSVKNVIIQLRFCQNELVRARLKNEDTEGELVRYKLL
jgi:hypothetical protein